MYNNNDNNNNSNIIYYYVLSMTIKPARRAPRENVSRDLHRKKKMKTTNAQRERRALVKNYILLLSYNYYHYIGYYIIINYNILIGCYTRGLQRGCANTNATHINNYTYK